MSNKENSEMTGDSNTRMSAISRRLLDVSDDGIYVVDKVLNIVAANDTVTEWSKKNGYKTDITGKNVLDVLPFLNEKAIQHIKEVIETTKPVYTEYIWPLERNRIIAAEIIPLFTRDADVQAITVAKDMGEQERIIERIIRRELATRSLLEQVTDGIHIYKPDSEIIYANEALSSRLGYTPEDLLNLRPVDIDISMDNSRFPKIHQDLLAKRSLLYETHFKTKDGREIFTEVNSSIIEYYGEEAVLSISRDVSERRIAIDSLETEIMRNNLEQSNRDFKIYTSLLQHDLRNDLHLILTQIDVSNLELPTNESESEALTIIHAAINRMSNLLDMLSISTEIVAQDLVSCLQTTASESQKITSNFQIDLVNKTGNELVQAFAGRLLPFVWINLLRNTTNFAGPYPHSQITISRKGEKIVIDFLDNGPGVSEEMEKQLFEKGASTSGSGFGLYLCRKIVEAYRGTIELVGHSGKGALFRITLLAV